MIKKVISYFNNEVRFYENIKLVENQSNDNIIGSCQRYVKLCPLNDAMNCVKKSIYIIGEFDDENTECPLVSYKEPVLIVDCDEILKVRFPQLYEQGSSEVS